MAKVVIGAEIKVDGLDAAGQSVGSFKKQLREAQADLVSMADKFGLASKEAQMAAMKVAGLKDSIGDAKALAETFNPDKKFVALGGAVQGVVAGFSAYSGAMGLLGIESKDTEKLLLKVQSAMAIQQGLSGIAGAVDSFKLLGTTIAQKVVTAFSTLRGAIISTGIGALVVGLGILIANFDKVKTALGFATVAQQAYNDTIEDYKNGAKTAIEKTNQVRAAFDNAKAGVLSKKEALEIYNTSLGDTLGKAKNLQQAEDLYNKKAGVYIQIMGLKAQANALFAKSADEAAKGIVAANEDNISTIDKISAAVKLRLGIVSGAANTLVESQKEGTELAIENSKKNSEALYQEGLKLGTQAEKLERDNAITITDIKEKAAVKVKKIDDKSAKDALELKKLTLKMLRDAMIESDKEDEKYFNEINDADIARTEANKQRLIDNETDRLQKTAELAELALLNDPNSIDKKIAKMDADLQVELAKLAEGDLQRQVLIQAHADSVVQINKDASDKIKADAEILVQHKKEMQQADFDLVGKGITFLKDIAGKNKALQKAAIIAENALGIAKIITNTNAANSAAILKYSLIPGGQALSAAEIVRNKIGAGIGIVSTIAATAKALSAIGGGGGATSGGSVGGSTSGGGTDVKAPIAPQAQTTNLSQASINAVGNAANRAYVLETDVSNNQERIRRLNRAARIN